MKKLYFILTVILFIVQPVLYSQQVAGLFHDNSDTLLFDGDNDYLPGYNISDLGCKIVVREVNCAKGNILLPKVIQGCGTEVQTVYEAKLDQELRAGDILQFGSSVYTTCDKGYIKIDCIYETGDGTLATFPLELVVSNTGKGNAGLKVPWADEFCYQMKRKKEVPKDSVVINQGKIFINLGKNIQKIFDDLGQMTRDLGHDVKIMTFNTVRTITSHNNTQFSIEIQNDGNDTIDVIKVYEGSVNVQLKSPEVAQDKQKAIEQAAQDFQNGKITAQEFGEKMKQFNSDVKDFNDQSKPVLVTEGNKCTATKSTMKVEPIEPGDEHWWENLH